MSQRIVIIGGMGPQASLQLHSKIIAKAARYGAKNNDDYPEILHASVPIPDFISSGDSARGLQRLTQALDSMHLKQNDTIVLACNTAHFLLPEIEATYNVKFVSLIQSTVDNLPTGTKRVGLMASPTTIETGLYGKPLSRMNCEVISPTKPEISLLEKAIRHIIANGSVDEVKDLIDGVIVSMVNQGAQKVILGCTELSVLFNHSSNAYIIDPLEIAVDRMLLPS